MIRIASQTRDKANNSVSRLMMQHGRHPAATVDLNQGLLKAENKQSGQCRHRGRAKRDCKKREGYITHERAHHLRTLK